MLLRFIDLFARFVFMSHCVQVFFCSLLDLFYCVLVPGALARNLLYVLILFATSFVFPL